MLDLKDIQIAYNCLIV